MSTSVPVYPDRMVLEYKDKTRVLEGIKSTFDWDDGRTMSIIVHPNGNYLYGIGGTSGDLQIYDISDRSSPSFVGSFITGWFGPVGAARKFGMVFDATGRYLYVLNGDTLLRALDLLDPESPVDAAPTPTTVIDGGSNENHVLNRVGSTLYVMTGVEVQVIDISTPDTPVAGTSISLTNTEIFLYKGYVTPDEDFIFYPSANLSLSSSDAILVIEVSTGVPVERDPIDLPAITAGDNVWVTGNIIFDTSVDSNLVWFIVGDWTGVSTNIINYYWTVWKKGSTWATISLISDSMNTSNEIVPSYLVVAPSSTVYVIGLYKGFILTIFTGGGETAFSWKTQYWRISSESEDPIPRLDQGASGILISDAQEDFGFNLQDYEVFSDELLVVSGFSFNPSDDSAVIFVLANVDITDNGWIDISQYARGTDTINAKYGIKGFGLTDRFARQGELTFRLNNHDPIGSFTPNHASVSSNWKVGAIVRWRVADNTTPTPVLHTLFIGQIVSINPSTDVKSDDKFVDVRCLDLVHALTRTVTKGVAVRINVNATEIIRYALAEGAIDLFPEFGQGLDETDDIYPIAFAGIDDTEATVTREIQRALDSERGYLYPAYRHSSLPADGGFRLESRTTRQNSPNNNFLVTDFTRRLQPSHTVDVVYNRVQAQYNPRVVGDEATTIVYEHRSTPQVLVGETLEFDATYRDPDEKADKFSAISVQVPERGVDFKFNSKKDGTGTDLSSWFRLKKIDLNNGNSTSVAFHIAMINAYMILFRLKGRGVWEYEPFTVIRRDQLSIASHGLRDIKFDLPLVEDSSLAEQVADKILLNYKDPKTFVRSARFSANYNQETLDAALLYDVGDKILVENTDLAISRGTTIPWILGTSKIGSTLGDGEIISSTSVYVIHAIKYIYKQRVMDVEWTLFPKGVFA